MSKEISILVPNGATRIGLDPNIELSKEQLIHVSKQVSKLTDAGRWISGDLYLRLSKYGDCQKICEAADLDYQTARNIAVTCKKFELYRRRYNLSFAHHEEAGRIEDINKQEDVLDKCERDNLNVKQTRQMVSAFKGLPKPTEKDSYQDYTLERWAVSVNTMLYVMSFKPDFRKATTEDLANHLLRNVEDLASGSDGPAATFREQVLRLKEGASRIVDALDYIDEKPALEAV
jgi:hypothetical protein